ncbi:uncharacterized protein LOC106181913 isoform X2 [Lingula anatina]|nr:uncharacterized protein LOC106181913 isoform X2 [Lingula anatina]XP_013421907.1 uncharacterized protein LOC106181913 isoform X2 [Lingula anatina]|eukprot:XP_013421906.1 uncharacterized protein LOC106181913 isoform X2 [Lingula anatina]
MAKIHQGSAILLCYLLLRVTQGNGQLDTRCPQGQAYESGARTCMDCSYLCYWAAKDPVSAKLCQSDSCAEQKPPPKPKIPEGEMYVKMPVWSIVIIVLGVLAFCVISVVITVVVLAKKRYLFVKGGKGKQVEEDVTGELVPNGSSEESF